MVCQSRSSRTDHRVGQMAVPFESYPPHRYERVNTGEPSFRGLPFLVVCDPVGHRDVHWECSRAARATFAMTVPVVELRTRPHRTRSLLLTAEQKRRG